MIAKIPWKPDAFAQPLTLNGTPIGPYDDLVAGQAQARKLILITRNTHEFSRVDGLYVQK